MSSSVVDDLAPSGILRASINLGNPVLAQGTPESPVGVTVDPAREAAVAFTAPYVVIEGVYVVARDSELATPADVNRAGVRIGVKQGSAYDLYLSRALQHATVVRGDDGVEVFLAEGLEAGAGIRQPATHFVESHPGLRIVEERFMEDPAGGRHDPQPPPRERGLPQGPHRGAEGRRIRRRGPGPLRPVRRHGRSGSGVGRVVAGRTQAPAGAPPTP